jgi:hypothetical protein
MSKRAFPCMNCWAVIKKILHKAGHAYIHNRIGASPAAAALWPEKEINASGFLPKPKQFAMNMDERSE